MGSRYTNHNTREQRVHVTTCDIVGSSLRPSFNGSESGKIRKEGRRTDKTLPEAMSCLEFLKQQKVIDYVAFFTYCMAVGLMFYVWLINEFPMS